MSFLYFPVYSVCFDCWLKWHGVELNTSSLSFIALHSSSNELNFTFLNEVIMAVTTLPTVSAAVV